MKLSRLLYYTHPHPFIADTSLQMPGLSGSHRPHPSQSSSSWPTPLQHGRCAGHSASADGDISTTAQRPCFLQLSASWYRQEAGSEGFKVMHRIPHGKLWHWPSTWGMCYSLRVFRSRPSWNSHPSLEKESILSMEFQLLRKTRMAAALAGRSQESKSGHQRETELETSQSLLFQHLPLSEVQSWEENSSVCLEPFVWV